MYTPEELKDIKHLHQDRIIAVLDEQGLQISQRDAFVEQQIKNLLSTGRKGRKSMIVVNEPTL